MPGNWGRGIIGPNVALDGLILNMDAASKYSYIGSGVNWVDLTKNRFNGTLVNGPTFNSGNNGSIVFDGINDYVSFGFDPTSFTSLLGTSFTVNTWIKPTGTNGTIAVFRPYPGAGPYPVVFQMNILSTNFYFIHGDGNTYAYAIAPCPSLNSWYNVAGVRDGNVSSIYVNGVFINSATAVMGAYIGTPTLTVGRINNASPYFFTGNIANVSIYNRSLSSNEIFQNYNALKTRYGLS